MTDTPTVACACHGHEQRAPHNPIYRRARAVRTDSIANVAVIVAAGLVACTGSAWPGLAIAGVIALLFLHSAYEIVHNARAGLRPTT